MKSTKATEAAKPRTKAEIARLAYLVKNDKVLTYRILNKVLKAHDSEAKCGNSLAKCRELIARHRRSKALLVDVKRVVRGVEDKLKENETVQKQQNVAFEKKLTVQKQEDAASDIAPKLKEKEKKTVAKRKQIESKDNHASKKKAGDKKAVDKTADKNAVDKTAVDKTAVDKTTVDKALTLTLNPEELERMRRVVKACDSTLPVRGPENVVASLTHVAALYSVVVSAERKS